MKEESPERRKHREKCPHFSGFTGQCYKHSIIDSGVHVNVQCNGKCERMKKYDDKKMKP